MKHALFAFFSSFAYYWHRNDLQRETAKSLRQKNIESVLWQHLSQKKLASSSTEAV